MILIKLADEVTFWLFLATAITLFAIAFRGLFAIALTKLPQNGLTEAIAGGGN